jgi:hypothetical protein
MGATASAPAVSVQQRMTRLTVLVSDSEATRISEKAVLAGKSVSAFLRDTALDDESEMTAQFDLMLDRMEQDLDSAAGELAAALLRMDPPAVLAERAAKNG